MFKRGLKSRAANNRLNTAWASAGYWWHSKVTWLYNSQLNHFYWRFTQLDCFNSNWRQKRPSMRKISCAGQKHFDQLKSEPGTSRKARPDLQLCAAVTVLKMAGDAIVTFKCLWRNYVDLVAWYYNSRKFLVFNHAKLPKIEYKIVFILVPFDTTYLFKSGFSSPLHLKKNKYRNRLNPSNDMCVAL